jgi:hypothetical protein
MIRKGTKVFLTTTNGGHITGKLLEDYRETYHAVVESKHVEYGYLIVGAERIRTIAPVEATSRDYGLHQTLYSAQQLETANSMAGDLSLA